MTQKAVWVHANGGAQRERDEAASDNLQGNVRRLRFSAEIESRIDHLPPFPTVLSELIGLTNSEKSAATDLRSCLEKDPVLTARLLKLANSAFYSPRTAVTSLQQAVVMLGHLTVKSLAMAAATLKFLSRDAEAYGMAAGGLWMHSYASAELAREIASALGWPDDEKDAVYVGALLHDIGKIILADILAAAEPGGQQPAPSSGGETVGEWESRLSGFTHFGVGERIARKWSLAPLTIGCIRFHHQDHDVPEEFAQEVRVVSLADAGARRLGVGIAEPDENPEREACLLEALSFPVEGFEEILVRYSEKSSETESLFSNLGDVS